jgi:hypothetical protein
VENLETCFFKLLGENGLVELDKAHAESLSSRALSLPGRGFYVAHDLLAEFLKQLEMFG